VTLFTASEGSNPSPSAILVMTKKGKRDQINICLDEIEAAYRIMVLSKSNKKIISNCKSWARKHRKILKEMKYKGKIPRQPRIMKRYYEEGNLFNE
jgi:hypothetical protein